MIIPSCFSHPSSPSSKTTRHHDHHREDHEEEEEDDQESNHSLITCIYQTHIFDSPTYLTFTWSKTLTSHTLTIQASDNSFSAEKISLRPPHFSLFRPKSKSRSKTLTLITRRNNDKSKLRLYWDFSRAEFAARGSSAEPESRFHLAIAPSRAERLDFFLGELPEELARRADKSSNAPVMISRREHVFGRGRWFSSRAVISGSRREIGIECAGGTMRVTIDGVVRLVVKRLAWKFRGNERISMGDDGSEVEFFWDVFNWVSGDGKGHGVFAFQAGDGGVWPEMAGSERKLLRKSCSSSPAMMEKANNSYYCNNNSSINVYNMGWSKSPSWSSVLQWAEESSDGGSRSSCSSSARSSVGNNSNSNSGGFSLLLYAWRKD